MECPVSFRRLLLLQLHGIADGRGFRLGRGDAMESHEIIILCGFSLIAFVLLLLCKFRREGSQGAKSETKNKKPPQGGSGTAPPSWTWSNSR
jgi:hypothetical protein